MVRHATLPTPNSSPLKKLCLGDYLPFGAGPMFRGYDVSFRKGTSGAIP